MKAFKKNCRKVLSAILAAAMVISTVPAKAPVKAQAASGSLSGVESAAASGNIVTVEFSNGVSGKITFLLQIPRPCAIIYSVLVWASQNAHARSL